MAKNNNHKAVSYNKWGYIFLIPFVVVYLIFQLVPLISTIYNSFFDAVTIEQRRNERCQMTHAPKSYWKDMCEMALLGRGTAGKAEQNAEAAR